MNMPLKLNPYILVIFILISNSIFSQQDPLFSQYVYSPMTINPSFAGYRGVTSIYSSYRSQWKGIDGSPVLKTINIESPIRNKTNLGLTIVSDELGPSQETFVDLNFAYAIPLGDYGHKLSFGLKSGIHFLDVNFSQEDSVHPTDENFNNVSSEILPTVGAGFFYNASRWYLGFSIPNFITSNSFDEVKSAISTEKMHYYLMGGYTFNISKNVVFRPTSMIRAVKNTPLSIDLSANIFLYDRLHLGTGYRVDDSITMLLGVSITPFMLASYSYDYNINDFSDYSNGSHEFLLRIDIFNSRRSIPTETFF